MKRTIYITTNGKLKREKNTLCFVSGERKPFVPIEGIGSIYLFGECELNKRLLEFLARNEITIHFFNYYGFYVGTFYPRTHYNSGYMIIKQAEHYSDPEKRVNLAKAFVNGSILNMQRVLKY